MSIVFDARRQAEQSRDKQGEISSTSQSTELHHRSSASQDAPAVNEESRLEAKQAKRPARSTARMARSNSQRGRDIGITKSSVVPENSIVRSLLRIPRSGRLSPTSRMSKVHQSVTIEPATLIRRSDPVYPSMAKEHLISGSVEVHFRISPEGEVYDVKAVKGSPVLASAALEAVREWSYKPARLNGAPVDSQGSTRFDFNLDRESTACSLSGESSLESEGIE